MKIEFEKLFYTISKYEEKDAIKGSGFKWNPQLKRWETTDVKVVKKLLSIMSSTDTISQTAKDKIVEILRKQDEVLQKSMSAVSDIDVPAPSGLSYMPFQKAGIEFIQEQKNVLIADEMGLGKTIQSIGYINLNSNIKKVLIICPSSLKINWKNELEKWLIRDFDIKILNGNSLGDITITNYESTKKYFDILKTRHWDLLILDESHYIKNYKAKRTQQITGYFDENKKWIRGLKDFATQKILLTGTPILNRPMELFTQLKVLGNELGKNFFQFRDSYIEMGEYGAIGAKNLEDLQKKLRKSCMIRREKKDVLLELPNKIRQIITLPSSILSKEDIEENKKIIQYIAENWDEATENLKTGKGYQFDEISIIRHKTSLAKVPYVIEHIENVLENEDKIVIFAHHHDVIDQIYEKFKDISVVATGNESLKERDEAINRFQNDPEIKIFIGSIQAMGVGITLTASSTVIFAEIEWRPGDLTQAEDRLHRIGQKTTVQSQYIVVDDSIDNYMIKKILEKMETIEKVVNSDKIIPEQKVE